MNNKRQQTLTQAASAHRENLKRNLQHRLEVARTLGNDSLVHQLEAEASYLHFQ